MPSARSRVRIAVNVASDAGLAALAVPLAAWVAGSGATPSASPVLLAWGAAALQLAALPFRLALHHWRFVGAWELVGVAAASALGAGLFAAGLYAARFGLPAPSFPVAHALALFALLALPRVVYRLLRETPPPAGGAATPVLLLGAGEGADRLLAALAAEAAPAYRAIGLLAANDRQTGRRLQGCPVLGSIEEAADVLARLRGSGEAPQSLVVTDPTLDGPALDAVLALARREALAVAWAPDPTALDRQPPARA